MCVCVCVCTLVFFCGGGRDLAAHRPYLGFEREHVMRLRSLFLAPESAQVDLLLQDLRPPVRLPSPGSAVVCDSPGLACSARALGGPAGLGGKVGFEDGVRLGGGGA